MKASVRVKAWAGATFLCSAVFCCMVLFGSGIFASSAGKASLAGEASGGQAGLAEPAHQAGAGSAGQSENGMAGPAAHGGMSVVVGGRAGTDADASGPVIVIDAGHGGFDGGAEAADGTMEKDINLAIAERLGKIMQGYGVDVVMSREGDIALNSGESGSLRGKKRQDLLKRREVIDASGCELAVSVHLNSFKQDASVYGAQVFYPKDELKRTDGRTYEHGSEEYAQSIQKALEMNISDGKERKIMRKDDFLVFENPACPMVLVECGFLSNFDETEKLKTAEYQEKLALAIWNGINEILCLEKRIKVEIIENANMQ